MEYLEQYKRLVGLPGRSLMEKVSADPKLGVLSKAFSTNVGKEDIKYLRFREVEGGVELKDMAGRLGNILTSVGPKEANPKALISFLEKGGAKPFKVEIVESFDEGAYDPKIHGKPGQKYWTVQSNAEFSVYRPVRVASRDRVRASVLNFAKRIAKSDQGWGWIKVHMNRDIPPKNNPYGFATTQSKLVSHYEYRKSTGWKKKAGLEVRGMTNESIVGAPGPFVVSDESSTVLDALKADLLDRVRRPRWEYPSWAFSKDKLDETG